MSNFRQQMSEIPGTIVIDDITFDVGYRFGGPLNHQGGYAKCLRIYNGKKGRDIISGHKYFGDDKFEVKSDTITATSVELELTWPLTEASKRYSAETFNASTKLVMKKN